MTLRRGCLWLVAGLLLALLAGAGTFVLVAQMAASAQPPPEPPKAPVVVLTRDLPVHTVVAAGDLKTVQMPEELVPPGALADPQQAVGQLTTTDLSEGEVLLAERLIAPDYVGPRAALVMDPRDVVVAFPADDLLSSRSIVRPGDHVDLMFTFNFEGTANTQEGSEIDTLTVLQDVTVAAVLGGGSQQSANGQQESSAPSAYLFALDPQDALVLKALRDRSGAVDLALRSPAAEGEFDTEPVDADYLVNRYQIYWAAQAQ